MPAILTGKDVQRWLNDEAGALELLRPYEQPTMIDPPSLRKLTSSTAVTATK